MKPFRSLLRNYQILKRGRLFTRREGVYVQVLLHDEAKDGKRIEQTKHVSGSVPHRIVPAPAGVVVVVVVPGVPEVAIVVIGV